MSSAPLPAVIPQRQARPPRLSLVTIAEALEGPEISDGRWHRGFTWSPERVSGGGLVDADCDGGTDTLTPDAELVDRAGDPYVVWAANECSTFGFAEHDYVPRAQRLLLATQSHHLAAELWDGALAAAAGASENRNVWLAKDDADELTSAAVSPLIALGEVEDALAFYLQGAMGMIHCTPQVLTHLFAADAVVMDGAMVRTVNGHKLVVDSGYSGDGPESGDEADSSSQWIYGTDLIDLLLGDIQTPTPGRVFAEMDRSVNTVQVYADRIAGWRWDHQCHVAAEVNVGVSDIGSGS